MDEAQFLEELKQDFFNEAQTLIESLEANVLIVEKDPTNHEAINEIFRVAHTIKGGSATLDLDRIARFTHEMENFLEEVRSGNVQLNPNFIDLLLKSIDIVKTLLAASYSNREEPEGYETDVIELLKKAAVKEETPMAEAVSEKPSSGLPSRQARLNLNEYERYVIKKAPSEGDTVYEVFVKFDNNNPMKAVSGLQIHSQLKDISEILKSVPDIDELMSDHFYSEVLFLVQSNQSQDVIYQKVYLSDVTELVEVSEFKEDMDEDSEKEIPLDQGITLDSGLIESIQKHLQAGKKVFKILVDFDDENPMRSVSGILFYTMLRTKGDVLISKPSYDEFKEDTFYPKGEFILVTQSDKDDLRNKLYLSDVTKGLKFQAFQRDDESSTPATPSPQVETSLSSEPTAESVPQVPFPDISKEEKVVVEPKVQRPQSPTPARSSSTNPERKPAASVLRVESSRIDDMLNLVGELVIIKASFMQLNDQGSAALDELSGALNQFKINIRQLGNDIDQLIDNQRSNSNHEASGDARKIVTQSTNGDLSDLGKKKEYFKDQLDNFLTFFDSHLPIQKVIQDKLKNSSQGLGRITDDLQESVMKVRMVPISQIFSRFPRLVRDISRNLKKNINLLMEGEETELDKSVIEDLVDPLIHIVRNAVDHGIESPEDRKANGKPEMGTVLLKAAHEGNTVTITVKDDGKGLALERIRKKAIESNLIDAGQELSSDELANLIFHPGLTTAKEVTSLSGRGVGMDVVKKKIENLGGMVEIITTQGQGSQFTIKIPLTLAIIQALLVKVQDYIYSIPINSVIETLRVGPEDIEILENSEVIRVREEVLSLVHLDQLFKHRKDRRDDDFFYVIVVGTSGRKIGIGVDNLVGEQDVVIKPLNNKYTNVLGIAGATILGDGQVSLVVDVTGLFNLIASERKNLLTVSK